ncbi:hypothetical protein D0T11_05075 [Hymenobacter rubripertinctus]|uniref:Uncharacterized protein n=2 Tax=Hymenobacter rubripertinctus TaxID=2029981 RepID=A0A418R4X5_9BACT|nr:hypothetical protein D0T11_05075 [Hymenobacter rubripertinctus]
MEALEIVGRQRAGGGPAAARGRGQRDAHYLVLPRDPERVRPLPGVGVLNKPLTKETLQALVEEHFGRLIEC